MNSNTETFEDGIANVFSCETSVIDVFIPQAVYLQMSICMYEQFVGFY